MTNQQTFGQLSGTGDILMASDSKDSGHSTAMEKSTKDVVTSRQHMEMNYFLKITELEQRQGIFC